jgi:respiratory burst oxidase
MKDSGGFAEELFDALARRKGQLLKAISLEELRDFWSLISDQKFDSRLQIFFDMYAVKSNLSLCFCSHRRTNALIS